ncbi:MAG TPA: hypothetical protein VIJ40_02780 [Acidimicrobiales bacterium]
MWGFAMVLLKAIRTKAVVRGSVVFVIAALVLAGCTPSSNRSDAFSSKVTITPAYLDPSSMCPSSNGFMQQSWNGDISGCFRVPALHSATLVVALQTFLSGTSVSQNLPTTTFAQPTTPSGSISLSLSPSTATPGETVAVTGKYLGNPPTQQTEGANLCWDGCRTGFEESIQVHWSSSTTFHAKLVVPKTAWLVSNNNAVSVHPLQSGNYTVGIQCVGFVSGCGLGGAEAQTTIHLKAPNPERCLTGQRCATLQLSTKTAQVGDVIMVKGWAPLQTAIGGPFGYDLSVTSGSKKQKYPSLSFERSSKSGAFIVVLAPKTLRIAASKTWADLGRLSYASSTYSGTSPVSPASNSNRVAWCLPSGIVVTDGQAKTDVATAGATTALAGTSLKMFSSSSSHPQCSTVLLDPRYGQSVYAGFGTAQGGSAPPIYQAGMYTDNGGATWHTVPTPPGNSLETFGGFTTEGDTVFALFAGNNALVNDGLNVPPGTTKGLVSAEATSNGGASWSTTTLGCPISGPCTTFGPYNAGNCNMSESPQSLLLGPSNAPKSTGVKWRSSRWVVSVNGCVSQQLVVTSPHDLLLLDPSSQYPVLRSTDSGENWSYFALPLIPGMNYGPDSIPRENSLVLAPNGVLFAADTVPNEQRQELFRLNPAATSWCQVPQVLASTLPTSTYISYGPLRVNQIDLMWSESISPSGAATTTIMHTEPLSSLRC